MIIFFNILFTFIALCYVVIFLIDCKRHKSNVKVFNPRHKSWRRDMTGHELEIYNQMRRHWAKQAKTTYRKINYERKNNY